MSQAVSFDTPVRTACVGQGVPASEARLRGSRAVRHGHPLTQARWGFHLFGFELILFVEHS